jgi:hypothetical protein
MHAASDHRRLCRRRGDCVLARCRRFCVGEPVAGPQLDVGRANPQPDANPQPNVRIANPEPDVRIANPEPDVRIANPEPDPITDFADRLSLVHPNSNSESRSDPHTEQQATTCGRPKSKPFAQFPAGTEVGSTTRSRIARHALPGLGTHEEAAPGHCRRIGAGDHQRPHPGGCPTGR